MFTNLVPFENVLERIKDDTGIANINNLRPKIRRLVHRVEEDLGFGGTLILKRVPYSIVNGSIIKQGNSYKAKLPPDVVRLEKIGMCHEGLCPDLYILQGNWIFFCKGVKVDSFSLLYYVLLKDGEGNPVITENHLEAVTAGVVYWLYKQSMFNLKKPGSMLRYYEDYYHERLAEARGWDIMPDSDTEFSEIASILRGSTLDAFYWDFHKECFCELEEDLLPSWVAPVSTPGGGYTDTTKTVGGNENEELGTGGSTDGNGGYIDPNAPAPNPDPDPEPEPVNQEPTISDLQVTAESGVKTTFTLADFNAIYADPEGDLMAKVRADAFNQYNTGKYYLSGIEVTVGTIITRQQIIDGLFYHIGGESNEFKTDYMSFSVQAANSTNWVS